MPSHYTTSRQTTPSTATTARPSVREAGNSLDAQLRNDHMLGYFAVCTSLTSYEPNAQLDDGNYNQFGSAQDDTEKSALLKHCLRPPSLRQIVSQPQLRSVIPHIKHRVVGGGNKLTNAGFHHKKRLSATEEQIVRNHRRQESRSPSSAKALN